MKLFSWNVNGVRAATKKGLFEWLDHEAPDILCIQETKAHVDQLTSEILVDHGYHAFWHSGERRGYSGVATFCREEPFFVQEGLGIDKYDSEGRVLITEHESFLLNIDESIITNRDAIIKKLEQSIKKLKKSEKK